MLILDDNNLKLLKMKEKLLEISTDDGRQSILEDYEKLAIEIDKSVYDSIIEKIKNSDYHNQSFEEQLSFLSELESEYDRLNELQHRFGNTYQKYSNDELELSNLESIFIDVIREKISNISGYLINVKNIEKSEKKLEELSEKLILEEQKKQSNGVRLRVLDSDLKANALKAEGRVYTFTGDIRYTSVVKEYEALGLNLEELIDSKLSEFEKKCDEQEKSLKAAEISYNSMSDDSYKDVYENIKKDAISARYELSLLKIARLLYNVTDEYDASREKREQLCDLIKYRTFCLEALGIRHSIDPFLRMRVKEQLEIINSFDDNTKDITGTRRDIFNLHSSIEEMLEKNEVFLKTISADVNLIADEFSMSSVDISSVETLDSEMIQGEKVIGLNQVVSISKLPSNFMFNRVYEKADGVIRRVNQMVNSPVVRDIKSFEVAPQLVIESSPVFPDIVDNKYDRVVNDSTEGHDVFEMTNDIPQIDDFVSHDDIKIEGAGLFQEVEPFDEIPLFVDKYDDGVLAEETYTDVSSLSDEELLSIKDDDTDTQFVYSSLVDDSYDYLDETLNVSTAEPFWMTQDEHTEDNSDEVVFFEDEFPDLIYQDDEEDHRSEYKKVRSRAA